MAAKISFNPANVMKCTCPKCPVQGKSKCVKGKMGGIKEALKKNPLRREEVPELYCSTGTASCKDIDPKQKCICMSCPIWAEYKLAGAKPVEYFCRDGAAK